MIQLHESILLIAGLCGISGYFYHRHSHSKSELADPDYRRAKADALRDPAWWRLYMRALGRSLDWLQRQFGHPLSARALGVCLTIGLLYGVVFLLLAWGFGAPATPHSTRILPDIAPPWRVVWSIGGLAWLTAVVWIAIRKPHLDLGPLEWAARRFPGHQGSWLVRFIFGLLVGIAVFTLLAFVPKLLVWHSDEGASYGHHFYFEHVVF